MTSNQKQPHDIKALAEHYIERRGKEDSLIVIKWRIANAEAEVRKYKALLAEVEKL